MANILKGKCRHCGSRATIIRTDPDPDCAILTHRCDNKECMAEFKTTMTYLMETKPPLQQKQDPPTFLDID